METKHEEASHMGMISCFVFPLFSSGLDTRLDPLEELYRWHIQQKLERNLIYLVKGLKKGTLPSTREQEQGDPGYCVQRGTDSGNISCA